jgi:hypothetical protein
MMTTSTTPDSCSSFLEVDVKMTCTKLSEMLYCDAMLLVICWMRASTLGSVLLLEFDCSSAMEPVSRRPLL